MSIEPLDDIGDLLTMDEFEEAVREGFFIDYDGFGHPATEATMDGSVLLKPSTFDRSKLDPQWTHVNWYNR